MYVVGLLNYRLPHRDETLWNTDNIVSRYSMGEMRSGELAPPTISVIFAELGRFTKGASECRTDRDWLFFIFRNGGVPEGVLDELRGEGFAGELVRACEVAGFGKEKKLNYERDMITERDRIAQDKFARKESFAEGLAEGRTETASAIAVRMLSDGMPLETVTKYSGLSEEEVRKLSQPKIG